MSADDMIIKGPFISSLIKSNLISHPRDPDLGIQSNRLFFCNRLITLNARWLYSIKLCNKK